MKIVVMVGMLMTLSIVACKRDGYVLSRCKLVLSSDKNAVLIKATNLVETHQVGLISDNAAVATALIKDLDLTKISIFPLDKDSDWTCTLFDEAKHKGIGQTVDGFNSICFLHGKGSADVVIYLKEGRKIDPQRREMVEALVMKSHSQTVF